MAIPVVQDPVRRLEYGPWVSLEPRDFDDYVEHYEDDCYRATYSGRLATALPGYEAAMTVPVLVSTAAPTGRRTPPIRPSTLPLSRTSHDCTPVPRPDHA